MSSTPVSQLERYSIRFTPHAHTDDIFIVERLIQREGGYILYAHSDNGGIDVLLNHRAVVYLKVNPIIKEFEQMNKTP